MPHRECLWREHVEVREQTAHVAHVPGHDARNAMHDSRPADQRVVEPRPNPTRGSVQADGLEGLRRCQPDKTHNRAQAR